MAFKPLDSAPELFSAFLAAPPKSEVLDSLSRLVDWAALRGLMAPAYAAPGTGRPGIDPVVLFKLLLLEHLFDLSDVRVVLEAADRLSFRAFLGLGPADSPPDDSTLVRFRARLRASGLLDGLFAEVTAQMEAHGLGVREGSIRVVDATLVQAAVRPPAAPRGGGAKAPALDRDADFTVRKGRPFYGFKVHLGQDRETGLLGCPVVTPASVHDSQVFGELLIGGEGRVLADKGYDGKANRKVLRERGIADGIMARAQQGTRARRPDPGPANRAIARLRGTVEGANAALKRWRRMGRAAYRGLERTWAQAVMAVLAHNAMRWAALARGSCAQ